MSDILSLTIVVRIASYSYRLLKYFRGYWQATKIILSNIFNNEIIPDENFPDYGMKVYEAHKIYIYSNLPCMQYLL